MKEGEGSVAGHVLFGLFLTDSRSSLYIEDINTLPVIM